MGRDTVLGTILVATVMCIVCSVLVCTAAISLRPQQEANQELDQKKNILIAAHLLPENSTSEDIDRIYSERVQRVLVNLETGEEVSDSEIDPETYNPLKAAKEKSAVPIEPDGALPGFQQRAPYGFAYRVLKGDEVDQYVLPVYGKGLWSTMYGFLALKADKQHVSGITFYEQGETPGLGGEVTNEIWTSKWVGKTAYDPEGDVVIQVIKGQVDPSSPTADQTIDGLSGATITTKGVSDLVRYWLSDEGYGKYLHSGT